MTLEKLPKAAECSPSNEQNHILHVDDSTCRRMCLPSLSSYQILLNSVPCLSDGPGQNVADFDVDLDPAQTGKQVERTHSELNCRQCTAQRFTSMLT